MSQSVAIGPPPLMGGTWPWYQPVTSPRVSSISSDFALLVEREFHTWREAICQANDAAVLFNTADKPRVRWRYDRWLLTYRSRPTLMNGATA